MRNEGEECEALQSGRRARRGGTRRIGGNFERNSSDFQAV